MRPRQDGRHYPDDIFKCIFFNENVLISINFSLKFVPRCPINNIPALVQIMAWRRPGDKPLSEPMMVSLPTHICVTRPQWVNLVLRMSFLRNRLCIELLHIPSICHVAVFNTLWPRQYGRHFAEDICNCILLNENCWFEFHWNLFSRVELVIIQHWFRWWLGTKQVASHYLKQWWPSLLTHISVIYCQVRMSWIHL